MAREIIFNKRLSLIALCEAQMYSVILHNIIHLSKLQKNPSADVFFANIFRTP